MTNWIVDTSVWSRVTNSTAVAERVEELVADPTSALLSCPPQVLEYCYLARSAAEYAEAYDEMLQLTPARRHPMIEDIAGVQGALFRAGMGRAAGPIDILTAAYARLNDAVVLTADRDYDSIARAMPDFRCEFVPPDR